ncbi:MAG TPA: hypothetical protein VMH30_09700 [Verrucomicrobiae bacterium]|nr:hypothetical protein [Verrucomicrobiae bacterium]
MRQLRLILLMWVLGANVRAVADDWETALSRMPLVAPAAELDGTNCVPLLLGSFQRNDTVKALIFMPGATDEIYFFRRVHATLGESNPTLLDAVVALTNQTHIQADFRPPFLILHTTEDSLEVIGNVESQSTAAKLRQAIVPGHYVFNDADWDGILGALAKPMDIGLRPRQGSPDSWHFYRHSFAAYDLSDWEMLEALALAGKTTFTVDWRTADFEPDRREGVPPKLDNFPLR